MGYGISATGVNNQYVIDSDTTSTEYMGVVASGISTINSPITTQQHDLVFARPYDSLSTLANRFVLFNRGTNDSSITFYQSRVSYIILRKTQSISGTASGQGDYGIQVNNAGGTLIYDSRKQNSGFKIIGTHNIGSFGGNRQGFTSTTSIPATQNDGYPGAGGGTASGNRSNIITTSNVSTTYVSCDWGVVENNGYFNSSTLYYQNQTNLHGYYYTSSNIQWFSYLVINIFGSSFNVGLSNFATVLRGQLI
tara:strand:+ start:120 stop:872 length:753 start_codon:yes stop_codon:yes gene_type:complete